MLKDKKDVKKIRDIIMILIAIILIMGIFINRIYIKRTELKTIGTDQIEHMNATTSSGNGTINPIYRPKWTKVSSTLNTDTQTLSIVVKGNASESQTVDGANINYSSEVTSALEPKDIMVYIDGELDGDTNKNGIIDSNETPSITKTISDTTPESKTGTEVTHTITLSNFGEALRQSGKEFTEWSGNVAIKIGGRGQSEITYNTNVLTDKYGNESMMETDQDGTEADGSWINVAFKDGSIDHNASGTMFADFVKPEFTYEYAKTTIDHDTKTVTLVFDITDKYFKESTLTADNITVKLGGIEAENAKKTLTKLSDITATVNGTASTKIGEKYQLVVSDLDQGDGGDYSGIMTVAFPEKVATDKSGNWNLAKTITVGIDDPTTGDGDNTGVIVDVVDPVWKTENISIDGTTKTVKVDLIATDKYLTGIANSSLTKDNVNSLITLTVDGETEANTAITKTLSNPEFSDNVTTGLKEIKYTLTLSNWEEASVKNGKNFLEYSGTTKITIAEGTITDDQSGATEGRVDGKHNTSKEQSFTLGHVDFIKPRIETVSTTRDTTAKTETIVFNVIDKYLDTSDEITDDEIKVLVDKEETTGLTKTLTRITANDKSATINGKAQVVLQQYQLVLSNFEQSRTSIDSTKNFVDWSGTVSIDIAEGAVKDKGSKAEGSTADNSSTANKNASTTINADFVDFIQPKVTYQYVTGDINYNKKTFTMTFEITDKYFTNSVFATEYTNATTDAEKLTVLQKYLTIKIDGEDKDITRENNVIKKIIAIEDVKATKTINKTVGETVQTGLTNQLIGKRFTLEISELQQDIVDVNDEYLDYSGVITVAVAENSATDNGPANDGINKSGNVTTTITSGVNIPGGTSPKDDKIVDVVDPIWEVAGTATAQPAKQTASIPIKGTDKYIDTIRLTPDDITVEVNGEVKTSADGISVTVTEDTSVSLTYGKQYIIKVDGYSKEAYQVKVKLKEGLIVDTSGNKSAEKNFILFSSLKETSTETSATSPFLGNSKLQRQKIEKIIFQDNLNGMNDTRWDVTQIQDQSIWGWYTTDATTGNYTVYIGSYIIMNSNVNSSYLFSYIGYDPTCKTTGDTEATGATQKQLIENIDLLHINGSNNMAGMFQYFGHATMKSMNLGTLFDTSNVTNMKDMFKMTGYTAMASFDLGSKFDTSNVTDMSNMFYQAGRQALKTLDLGEKFNTSNVTNMSGMFNWMGTLTTLNLGENFDTSKVTDMSNMFWGTGYSQMTDFSLGDKFDTSKVTNMSNMFYDMGGTALKALDLGDKFYTTSATNMSKMFYQTGKNSMVALDLGPVFTKIASTNVDMFTNTGKADAVIYAPESIFSDEKNFKLNSSSTTKINYTRGIIDSIYRPEFTKVSSTLDTSSDTPSMTIVVKGEANKTQEINGVNIKYNSDVVNKLTSSDITVYVNGEKADSITKQLISATTSTNSTTGKTEITYTIKISNFDQGARQKGSNGKYKNFTEWSGNIALQFANGKLIDKCGSKFDSNGKLELIEGNGNLAEYVDSSNTTQKILIEEDISYDKNTEGKMFVDTVKPEFTYLYSDGNINVTDKTLTVDFSITDKYYDSSTIIDNKDKIEVKVIDTDPNVTIPNDKITKEVTKIDDITDTVNGKTEKIGEKYRLVIKGLQQEIKDGEFRDYSGPMSVVFPKEIATDKSGNTNIAKTITIGVNDSGENTGNQEIVDVVSPSWSIASADPDTGIIKIRVKDKYLTKESSKFELEKEDIKIVVNGVESTAIVKTLDGPTEITANKEYEYTLTLSNLEPSGGGYTEFTPIDPIIGGTAKYRNENGGAIRLRMLAGTVTDQYGNKTEQQDLEVGNIDITEPEIYYIQKTRNIENNKETIIFNVTDKNYNEEDPITVDEMTLWIDGKQVDSQVTKEITNAVAIRTTIDGQTRVVGHQYTLEIGSIVETNQEFINSNRAYRELSGTLEVKINKDAATDLRGNTLNEDTTTITDTTDLIRPEVKYQFATSNIDKTDKTFTMVFEIVDKYYKENLQEELKLSDLKINIDGKEPNWNEVTKSLNIENISATVNGASKVIGKKYTLKLSNLEQLQIKDGDNYRDYSGVITVGIPADKMADETGNKNIATTITSGVNIPGGTGAGQVVDVVAPLIEKESSSADAINKTATLKFKVTDKYFKESTITEDNIKVLVNGTETTSGITKTLSSTELKEDRTSGETTTEVPYGVEYTLTITGFATDAGQVKVQIPAGLVTDDYENSNIVTEMILYNVLKRTYTGTYSDTNSESSATAGFLGNTSIQRQNIENITFTNNIPADVEYDETTNKYKNATTWDVSESGDKTILAWYETNANGSLKVYIGSKDEIFANQDSTDLFAYIGYADKCTATETITNIDLLNVMAVTNMRRMFRYTGHKAMTSLDLGSKFNTSNVTNMIGMFEGTGYKAMTTLNLGGNFNTGKVTNMSYMFNECGHDKLEGLNLGNNFNTSKVTDMQYMFANTGHDAMTSLDLGSNFNTVLVTDMSNMFNGTGYKVMTSLNLRSQFNTSKVTKMNSMFEGTGYTEMTSLNLGTLFDTSLVTDMSKMFYQTGHEKMTTLTLGGNFNTAKVTDMSYMFSETGLKVMTALDLGDVFYTTAVTNMSNMFNACGQTAMTALDLGPAFTKIADTNTNMFTNTGKSGTVIYAPESIYKNKTSFKKSSTDTTTTAGAIAVSTGRTVNPIYKPEWTKTGSALKPSASAPTSLEVTVKGNANKSETTNGVNINYNSNVTSELTPEDITVYINGVQDGDINGNGVIDEGETPVINVAVSEGTPSSTDTAEITQKITLSNFEEATRRLDSTGKLNKFSEWSGNISIKIGGREEATSTYTVNSLTDIYGNQSMSETDETGSWVNVLYKDTDLDGDKAQNTDGTMFTDFIKPEFTYEYSDTVINHGTKTVTVIFDVADKYFKTSELTSDTTASKIALSIGGVEPTNAKKTLSKESDLTATVNGKANTKVGERYKLVVTDLDQGDADNYSGVMTMSFTAGLIKDKSGNGNIAKTITIGIDDPEKDPDHKNDVIVDVVSPLWKVQNTKIDSANKKVTADLIVTDKYLTGVENSTLKTDNITVEVDGETKANTSITKTLSNPTYSTNETTGLNEIRYTLTLSNWEETEKQSGKSFLEYSGTTKITIAKDVVTDQYTNKSNEQSFTLGHVDFIKPRVEKVSSTRDATAKTETIRFNVIDKYLDTTKLLTADNIKVFVDGEEASNITKSLTRVTANDTTATVSGSTQTVSQQYELVLSDFEKSRNIKEYKDWSGTVTIEVATNVIKDKEITSGTDTTGNITSGGNTSDATILKGDFVDFIKPDLKYVHQSADINKDGKSYTMTFTVTDKYYRTGKLTLDDLVVKMQNGQKDSSGNEIIYNLKNEPVTMSLQDTELRASNVPITNTSGNIETVESLLIGHTYKLTISNLEQLERKTGLTTADYSGIITVAVAENKELDRGPAGDNTNSNGNVATTITSGVNIPGGTSPDDAKVVDVVDPIWEKISTTASAIDPSNKESSTATIKFKGTDTYFASSNLTVDMIKVFVDGEEDTEVLKTLSTATELKEERKDFGKTTTTTKQYGVEYTLTLTGFAQNANQVKIQLPERTILDESGNGNKVTEMILYNVLKNTSTETEASSGFLGNMNIQRQNINNITFVNGISEANDTKWDASEMGGNSILAWYTENDNGTLNVYIGSDDEIFANQDSSNLFAYIGYSDKCTSTETITNIDLLNVTGVTNMTRMFRQTGANSMTKLDLGSKFDTSNVTNMSGMFAGTGNNQMTDINLGSKFDTSKVTDMSYMFDSTGYKAMTTLNLGDNFNTSKVTDMQYMFANTGHDAMTSLDLGENFNTNLVTDMNNMFNATGHTAMTNLNLRNQFNTSKVTKMNSMFEETGYTLMESLDLGELFDTSAVTDMSKMFYKTGHEKMTTLTLGDEFNTSTVTNMSYMFSETGSKVMTALDLGDKFYTTVATDMSHMFENVGQTLMTNIDLGPAFTRIASTNESMFVGAGKSGEITIYVSEQIYLDKNNFKLDTNATDSAINYTTGTINPKYRTEWVKESSVISKADKNITITLRGRTNAEAGVDFTSNVTSSLKAENIHVLFDGEEVTTITKSLANVTTATNALTNANDVLQVLTLSNLEETLRQQGKNFKEWSGNISLKIDKKTLTDETYKNQNLQKIDTTGEMIDIEIKDTATDKNENSTMFTDYIKPEFTYEYFNAENDTDANTVIDYDQKTITVVFDVTDKYFKQANITADNMTIKVGGEEPDWTKSTKTLTKKTLSADKVVGNITYKANGDIYYTVNGTPTKIGERYELVVSHLEVQNGVGYSGAMTLSFPAGELNSDGTLKTGIVDKSGNLSLDKTITIGIDEPENPNHPDHKQEEIVDLVNPLWTGPHNVNTIDRTNNTVDIKILGSDQYYDTDVFAKALADGTINEALSKIKVYVDDVEQTSITKTLTKITDNTELQTLIAKSDLQSAKAEDVKVGYTLTLGNFGETNGETKIVIAAGTIEDKSGNKNIETTIPVGNVIWKETNEPLNESDTGYPRYHAFREDIVDFIKPVIKYKYSAVEDDTTKANPEIDYEAKTLTVRFTVTDKYLVESSIMNADGTLNTNNVRLKISTLNESNVEEFKDITDEGISTTITSREIENGYEYTLVVKDFEQVYNNKGKYMDYSGIVQLAFAEGQIDDTSGNKNIATTITLDTGTGDKPGGGVIVDVIDPIIEKTAENLSIVNASNGINRDKENETGTVTLMIKATDKYLSTGTLQNAENVEKIKVKVIKPDGTEVTPDTITKSVTQVSKQATSITYRITLGNFETNEGVTSVIIPADVIKDTSGNGNKETEILVGNSTWTETGDAKGEYTAFRDSIVDFTMPVWKYATSSITRNRDGETGTVKVKILGSDIYYLKDTLTTDNIFVYVANSETPDSPVTTITKSLEKITDTADLEGADTGYYLTLGNFGTHDGQVKITIADNTMKDTSGNGNKITEMLVGNPNWVETDIGDNETSPKYTAFRNSIVDFIKPTIKYQYIADTNPIVDQENKTFTMTFDAIDTNFLESTITLNDIQILVDDVDVTDTLTKDLTSADITDGSANGLRYTLTLKDFELEKILEGDAFKRHSGKIELVIAAGKVKDTSGNENIETRIIVDNDDGDDANNYIRVDFIKPKLYYVDKHISWDNRYATVTIAGTDRFYDFNTKLDPNDIKLYQENKNGEYVEVTNLPISIKSEKTEYGYNFIIRLDDFEEEYKMKISIPAGKIGDLDGHYNDATDIIVGLDNKKPVWKYVSTDTSQFESDGKLSFNVKGQDKFLDLTKSGLEDGEVSVYKDGIDISETAGITINYLGQDEEEKSKSYKIDVTGLTETGTYSLVFKEKTLIDEFNNESATTTITFSKSIISSNTDNYQKVTYHASPDFETTHESYVHELMSVNTTGTNAETTTFRPSTIGEIYDEGKNTLFAEPFTYENGTQSAYSFKGWAVANEEGFIIDKDGNKLATSEGSTFDETKATIYGLYDEIPDSAKSADDMIHLKAVWQKAKVIFVSSGKGDNSADGLSPTTPVKDLQTAYSKLGNTGKASENIIVIMDKVEWNSSTKLTGNATITNLYAGVDYKADGAELKISSNLEVDGDIKFDNIKLYSNSTTVNDGSDYLANENYTNMLITNYGDVTLGRRISTPEGKYTFGAVVGGNYKTEQTTGEIGIHTVIVEAGRYNNIVIGSSLSAGGQTTKSKYVSHQVLIGNMKDSAISRNDNLTITGYLSMGELEDRCYPYNSSGSQDTANGYTRTYAITKLYSGTFTDDNKFTKASENASIYLRSMNGFTDGVSKFEMYGGNITGNVYAGARMATTGDDQDENILNFYGGNITGNVFGHGSNDASVGKSNIELGGRFSITGNIFGGSNATTIGQGRITGNTTITMNTASVTVDGNIYGGSNGNIDGTSINLNNGFITGDTNIEINAGTITGDIFGGGYNCGNTGSANITINNGVVSGSIYGGAYQNQVRTEANITIKGGTVNEVYGGNVLTAQAQQNSDSTRQNANITIDGADATVNGPVYGSGKYDKVGTATINLISCATTPTVFGGSKGPGITDIVNINLEGMTVSEIYGGSDGDGTVTTANINLKSGTATDVYGGGYGGTTTTANVNLEAGDEGTATVTSIYGGGNTAGTVGTSNVTLKSGTVTNVFGGGNSAGVGTANVALDGITIDTIHGGSKDAKVTTNTNVVLKSGKATNVFGGGLGTSTTNAKVTQQGAEIENIYGGGHDGTGNGGITANSTVNIDNGKVTNVYGGSVNKEITQNATINIRGTSRITGKLYGGGYKSEIGKSDDTGSTTINISGGTIDNEIFGGSENSAVYGTTNINIGIDAVTDSSPVAGNINIKGNIYGGGTATSTDYSYTGVYGNTHVTLDNSTRSPITFNKSILGSGKGTIYSTNNTDSDESTIRIKNFGTASSSYRMTSVQRTGKVYIGKSYLELTGAQDNYNYYKNTAYTLNRVTKGLALHDNSTLYTRRGFNMVGGFESFITNENGTTTKETVSISENSVTRNVDNRIYTFEGINIIFAKQEGELSDKSNQDIWGDVNGMAFFGMYRINRTTLAKEYDIYDPNYTGGAKEGFFANGTYIEGRHKANHDITVDGFYTNVGDYSDPSNITVMPKVIEVTDYGTYYDWIIGEDIVNYNVGPLIASTYSTWSQAELKLDYKYQQGAMYTLNRISTNALDENINFVNKSDIQTIASSDTANNTFAFTVEGEKTGWLQNGVANMYTDGNGSFDGNTVFKSDNSSNPGTLIFKIFNSINVTETKDLGNINIVLIGKTRTGDDASQGNVFRIIISVSLQSLYEEPKDQYNPRFTDSTETNLNYTTDSSVDMSYILYKTGLTDTVYTSGDYRTLSSTVQLPAGTKITMRDYGQGDNVNKVYYYQIGSNTAYDSTENVDGKTRYVYKLSHFRNIGTNTTDFTGTGDYANNNSSYYHSGADGSGYALEKYDISIDFGDSNINANQLAQETYLQLRSADGRIKYDNGDKDLTYNLYNNNATNTETISNEGQSYTVFENLSIPFTFDATLLEKVVGNGGTVEEANGENATESTRIHDTKYYNQKAGLAIEIVDEVGQRVNSPELQNFKLTNVNDSTLSYSAGDDGVIRVPLSDGLAKIQNNYTLSLSQYNVPSGTYTAKVYFFTSDDGLHYNEDTALAKEIKITFINKLLGLAGVDGTNDSRIINKTTGLNLEGNNGVDLKVTVGSPTSDTNVRVELYKRNPTYAKVEGDSETESDETYTGTQYTQVDLKQYLEGEWETPEDQGLVSSEGSIEYMFMPKESYDTVVESKEEDFKKAIKQGISTGEYKLLFKTYYDNTLVQTVTKTFVVTP